MATINGIPVYNATITDEGTGMLKISLVDSPAVMDNFVAFSEIKKQHYSITDEDRHLVRGVVMRADFPIYRADVNGEYYVIYSAEEIRKMAEKYLAESRQNNVNTMHGVDTDVVGVNMVQYFIKGDGVEVEGFDDCKPGSLFAEFHVTNEDVWVAIKNGTYKGFSLEGIFSMIPNDEQDKVNNIINELDGKFSNIEDMSKLNKFKSALAKVLMQFGTITTDKAVLSWDGDEDLKAGDKVYTENENGERKPAEAGDYKTDDGKVIIVDTDGVVVEIKDAEAEVADEGVEVVAEAEETTEEVADDVDALKEENATLKARIEELERKIAELEEKNKTLEEDIDEATEAMVKLSKQSLRKSAHEENKSKVTGIKKLDKLSRYFK